MSLQRCHSNFWICLSRAYRKLREATLPDCGSAGCCVSDRETLTVVLAQTVQLFRPYFTWRLPTSSSEAKVSHPSEVSAKPKCMASQNTSSTMRQNAPSTAYQSHGEATCQDIKSAHRNTQCDQDNLSCDEATCENTVGTKCQDAKYLDGTVSEANCCSNPVNSLDYCAEVCIFSGVCVSQDLSYDQTLRKSAVKYQTPPVPHKVPGCRCGLVPSLDPPVCCCHSPFTMLLRQLLRPDEFPALSDALHGDGLSGVAHQLWASIFAMAECSCLVWAR